jgi:hypothetical protein
MNEKIRNGLFVDDVRDPPRYDDPLYPENHDISWVVARSFHEAICELEKFKFDVVSLDHDLGCFYGNREMTGDDVLQWLIQRKLEGIRSPEEVRVHSANSAKATAMWENANRYFNEDYFRKIGVIE